MKIEKTKITSYLNSSVSVISREDTFFQSPFHSHPELELVYIKESYGKRIGVSWFIISTGVQKQ